MITGGKDGKRQGKRRLWKERECVICGVVFATNRGIACAGCRPALRRKQQRERERMARVRQALDAICNET